MRRGVRGGGEGGHYDEERKKSCGGTKGFPKGKRFHLKQASNKPWRVEERSAGEKRGINTAVGGGKGEGAVRGDQGSREVAGTGNDSGDSGRGRVGFEKGRWGLKPVSGWPGGGGETKWANRKRRGKEKVIRTKERGKEHKGDRTRSVRGGRV